MLRSSAPTAHELRGSRRCHRRYVDLVEAGIIDPTRVVRVALENAVSVASVLLLTEATLTELPVPVGISGSRTVLRADQWFPRRGPITVTLRPPLLAQGGTWEAAVELRRRARAEVADAAQEPLVE